MPFSGIDNQSKFGSAFVYGQDQAGVGPWEMVQKLERADPENNDQYGTSVALAHNTAAIGVGMDDDLGGDSGAVYFYRLKFNNPPLLVSAIPDQMAATNASFQYTVPAETFADPDVNDMLVLSATLDDGSPLPSWLLFDNDTRTFIGNPDLAGSYLIRVVATDEDGASVESVFQIAVSSQPLNLVQMQFIDLTISSDAMNGQVLLSYDRPLGALDNAFTLEVSPDLQQWRNGDSQVVSRSITPIDPFSERVTLRLVAGSVGNAPTFFRVRAQQ
jgi:hypothetical protein